MTSQELTSHEDLAGTGFGGRLCWLLAVLAAAVLALLMALTCTDVFGRYVLNSPIPGAAELVEQMMGVLIFCALPAVTLGRRHITIDLLDSATPPSLARARDLLISAVSAVGFGGVSLRLWIHAGSKHRYNDVTEFLNIPLYPIAYLMSVVTGLTCILLVAFVVQDLRKPRISG